MKSLHKAKYFGDLILFEYLERENFSSTKAWVHEKKIYCHTIAKLTWHLCSIYIKGKRSWYVIYFDFAKAFNILFPIADCWKNWNATELKAPSFNGLRLFWLTVHSWSKSTGECQCNLDCKVEFHNECSWATPFRLFINDLPEVVRKTLYLVADTRLLAEVKCLQDALQIVIKWRSGQINGMSLQWKAIKN